MIDWENREAVAAYKRAWYFKNKERIAIEGREYREKHKDRIAIQRRIYRKRTLNEKRLANRRWREANRDKANTSTRNWRNKLTPHERYEKHLKVHYGLDREAYQALLAKQGGACAICHTPPNGRVLDVDHDHITNIVRGLLCRRCNLAVGYIESLGHEDFLQAMVYMGYGD